MANLPLIIVRIPKKVAKQWVLRHERDGLDEYGISIFLRLHSELQYYVFMRERKIDDLVELILNLFFGGLQEHVFCEGISYCWLLVHAVGVGIIKGFFHSDLPISRKSIG